MGRAGCFCCCGDCLRTGIGEFAFYDCSSLTDVYYTGTEQQWSQISIDAQNERLLSATLHCIRLENILDLPASLTAIESGAFTELPSIDAVRIPANVTSIAADAFDPGTVLLVPAGSGWVQWADANGYAAVEE